MAEYTWEAARQDYLLAKALQGLSQRTLDDYDTYTARFTCFLAENDLGFTTPSIRAYLASLKVGPVTLGIRVKVLRTYTRWLTAEGYLPSDPMASIPNPKVPQQLPTVLSEDDIKKLIKAAKKSHRDLAIVLLLLDSGIGASECCDATLRDLDLGARTLMIRNGKGGKDLFVFFSDFTARGIKRWLAMRPDSHDDAVFLSQKTKERLTRNSLCQIIKRLGGKAGVSVHPHLLRSTFATRWIMNGGDSHSLMAILGHTTTRMAEKYVGLVDADVSALHRQYSPVARMGLPR